MEIGSDEQSAIDVLSFNHHNVFSVSVVHRNYLGLLKNVIAQGLQFDHYVLRFSFVSRATLINMLLFYCNRFVHNPPIVVFYRIEVYESVMFFCVTLHEICTKSTFTDLLFS